MLFYQNFILMKHPHLTPALLLLVGFICSFAPSSTQRHQPGSEANTTKINNPEKTFLNHVDACLTLMEQEAQKLPIAGVAMVAFIPGDKTRSWTSKMKVVGDSEILKGGKYNTLAIAYAKAGEMALTQQHSGDESRKEIVGELGYKGGAIIKVDAGYLVAAFSGGTGQQDFDISQVALDWLAEKF